MKELLRNLLFLLTVCFLASCMSMQSRSFIVLNPDMSGKCTYEIKMGKDMAGILTMPKADGLSGYSSYFKSSKKSTDDVAMMLASKMLSSGKIDAWKDVQFGYLKKDTVFFKGTAYFKDISKMAVSMFDSSMRVYKDADGNMVLEMTGIKKKSDTAITWTNHSYDSITNSIYKEMGLSDIMHYYMASMVKGLDVSATYQLPGKIINSSNFVRKGDNTVSISLTGNDVIKLLDSMSANSGIVGDMYGKYMSGLAGAGYGNQSGIGDENSYGYYKILYGEAKPVQVVFKPDAKPSFDYAKEIAEAKIYYAKFRRTSGIAKYDSLQTIVKKEEEEEKQKEQGTLVLTKADTANNKIHFKSLTASQLYGDDISFSGTVSKSLEYSYDVKVKLTKVTDDKGHNITDSLNKRSYYYSYNTDTSPQPIVAYLSKSSYDYNKGYAFSDTAAYNEQYDKISFSLYSKIPEGTKFINMEGVVEVKYDSETTVIPFKIITLYIKPKEKSGFGKW